MHAILPNDLLCLCLKGSLADLQPRCLFVEGFYLGVFQVYGMFELFDILDVLLVPHPLFDEQKLEIFELGLVACVGFDGVVKS